MDTSTDDPDGADFVRFMTRVWCLLISRLVEKAWSWPVVAELHGATGQREVNTRNSTGTTVFLCLEWAK